MLPRGLLQEYANALGIVSRVMDVVCVVLAAMAAHYWRFQHFHLQADYFLVIFITALMTFVVFSWSGIYTSWRGRSWLHQARVIILSWIVVLTVVIILGFFTKTSSIYSRQWMIMWSFLGLGFLLAFRFGFYRFLQYMRAKGWNHKRIVIIGTGDLGHDVANRIRGAVWTGLDPVGFVRGSDDAIELTSVAGLPVLGGAEQLLGLIQSQRIHEVWLALPLKYEEQMREILDRLQNSSVTVRFVPGIFGFRLLNHAITEVAGLPVIDLNASPMVGINRFIKAVEDRVLAVVILVLLFPIMVLIGVGIKLTSKGPMLFKQYRHGWDGVKIKVYKFRTMVVHQEDGKLTQAISGDQRVTKFGAFLRRTSLDELPQFYNVLQGRMSIVGPRPHAMQHNDEYKEKIDAYMQRHKVKPGITGWAQVHGLRGETDTLEKMKRRVEFDMYYIEHWSLWLDMKIIAKTIMSNSAHKNAY